MSEKIRTILADDHAVVRAGIRQFLEHAPDISVVAEADDGDMARTLIARHKPDVAVLDIQMPHASGIEVTRWIRANYRDIGVLVLTAYDDDPYVMAVLQAGANGYVLKTASPAEIVQAVRDVNEGKSALDPHDRPKIDAPYRRATAVSDLLNMKLSPTASWKYSHWPEKAIPIKPLVSS